MTGLDVETCAIVEVATIVTGADLQPLGEYEAAVHQPEGVLAGMNDFVRNMHTSSGLLDRVRANPPAEIDGIALARMDDLAAPGGPLPPTDGLRLTFADDARAIIRPSGTEPKLKCYLEAVAPVADASELPAMKARVRGRLSGLKDYFTKELVV